MEQEFEIPKNLAFNTSGLGGVYDKKIHLNKKSVALGDKVIIKLLEQDGEKQKYGDIIIPDSAITNVEMLKGIVISVGPEAAEFNIKAGDIVLYDRFSAYYKPPVDPGTFIVTNIENVIVKIK